MDIKIATIVFLVITNVAMIILYFKAGMKSNVITFTKRKNKHKHASANEYYYWLDIWSDGKEQEFAFTEDGCQDAMARAAKNQEDKE